jgi:hypothetical protein
MTSESKPTPAASDSRKPHTNVDPRAIKLTKLPGVIAISAYMFLLAVDMIALVVTGRAQALDLIFAVFFIAGGLGLLFLLRWAWALTLAAVALSTGSSLWAYSTQHDPAVLLKGLLSMIVFLYLVRTEVRAKLR